MSTTRLGPVSHARLAVACHEMGHAVVGVLHGAHIDSARLTAGGHVRGVCSFDADTFGTRPTIYRPHIAAAGAVAAAMFHHGQRPTVRQMDALLTGADREELRRAALNSSQPLTTLLTEVLPVVRRCWPAITTLAPDMFMGGAIGHDDVMAALGITDGGGPGSFDLANLRARLRAVPPRR